MQKPGKGSVLAYWQAEEGLKAADSMKVADQEGGVAGAVGHERHHPARRVDPTGSHPASLEAGDEADEPSVAPKVKLVLMVAKRKGHAVFPYGMQDWHWSCDACWLFLARMGLDKT